MAGHFLISPCLTEMMRHWGLPTDLVTGNIGGDTDQAYGLNPGRFLRNIRYVFLSLVRPNCGLYPPLDERYKSF